MSRSPTQYHVIESPRKADIQKIFDAIMEVEETADNIQSTDEIDSDLPESSSNENYSDGLGIFERDLAYPGPTYAGVTGTGQGPEINPPGSKMASTSDKKPVIDPRDVSNSNPLGMIGRVVQDVVKSKPGQLVSEVVKKPAQGIGYLTTQNPWLGALGWGLPAAGLTYLASKPFADRFAARDAYDREDYEYLKRRNRLGATALAGLALGGLGYHTGRHYQRTKQSSFNSFDPLHQLLNRDNSVSYAAKQSLLDAANSLSERERNDLIRLVSGVGGGAVAGLIAKFLLGKGIVTSTVTGLLSGIAASNIANTLTAPSRNAGGLRMVNSFNMYDTINNNPRFLF